MQSLSDRLTSLYVFGTDTVTLSNGICKLEHVIYTVGLFRASTFVNLYLIIRNVHNNTEGQVFNYPFIIRTFPH